MTRRHVLRRRPVGRIAHLALAAVVGTLVTVSTAGVATAASGGVHRHDGRTDTSTQQPSGHGGSSHDDMPGMDHGSSGDLMTGTDATGHEMPGMDHGTSPMSVPDPERPLGLVLGGFGTASAAVLVAAAILRRSDAAARAARRARLPVAEGTT